MTVKEIAELAGVSIGTVDRVLHGRGRVSAQTSDTVRAIIDRNGFTPNPIARRLKRSRDYRFAVLLPDGSGDSGYWAQAETGIAAAAEELRSFGVRTAVFRFDRRSVESFREAADAVLAHGPDALLLAPVRPAETRALVARLGRLPYAFFDADLPETTPICRIAQDPYRSGFLAGRMAELLAGGPRPMAVLGSHPEDWHVRSRRNGFVAYAEERRIPVAVREGPELEEEEGAGRAIAALLEEEPETAAFFFTGSATHRVAAALKPFRRDRRLCLVGYDLVPENELLLRTGGIDALISQKPETQGREGLMALYRTAVLERSGESRVEIPIDLYLKENLPYPRNAEGSEDRNTSTHKGVWTMGPQKGTSYVVGLDYGTDSCRAVVVDAADGSELGVGVCNYPRWAKGMYCDPAGNRFRQHPKDYIESMESAVKTAVEKAGAQVAGKIKAIAIDTTGSTPCAADATGTPLALSPQFAESPSAMFVLWKDHTSVAEAARINQAARTWGGEDFTRFEGGIYSSEWFWAKTLRVLKEDAAVAKAMVTVVEHCDWMPALLTGVKDHKALKRSRCAMGHKAMWHASFGGYPADDFLAKLDPKLVAVKATLGAQTYTSDNVAGGLTKEWAAKLGLPEGIPVGVGGYDAHMGAVGGGAKPNWLVKVMGTSTCDMIVAPKPSGPETPVRGICGQVDGSVVPGFIGYEAGQSAFGDVYAWFKQLLAWPTENLLAEVEGLDAATREKIVAAVAKKTIPALEKAAGNIDPEESGIVALDWLNGRRTPDANQLLKGAVMGLNLGSDAPKVFRALVEGTAFGARAIVERFREEGVAIEGIIGIGGVARKSSFVMQIIADVLNAPIEVPANDQSVALGAAMYAAVVGGLYPDVGSAQKAMASPVEKTYRPDPKRAEAYDRLYRKYRALGSFVESAK